MSEAIIPPVADEGSGKPEDPPVPVVCVAPPVLAASERSFLAPESVSAQPIVVGSVHDKINTQDRKRSPREFIWPPFTEPP